MTPPITPITVPLVLADDPTLVGSLVTVGTAESDTVSAFVVLNVVINPAVVDMSAEGHEFLPSSAKINNLSLYIVSKEHT